MRRLLASLLCVSALLGTFLPAVQAWAEDACCEHPGAAEETGCADDCTPFACHCACCPGRFVESGAQEAEAPLPGAPGELSFPPLVVPIADERRERVFHPPRTPGVLPALR